MLKQLLAVVALALALASPALPQGGNTCAQPGLSPRGQATLPVPSGSSTAATALPGGGAVLYLRNNGAFPLRFQLGDATVQATATTSFLLNAGECSVYSASGATYIAAWGIGGVATLEMTQGNGQPAVSCATIVTGTPTTATVTQGTNPWPASADVCASSAKSSVPINIVTATTTLLVAVSGTKAVYVCGVAMTIAPSQTSAASASFEFGTDGTCTGANAVAGIFGGGFVAAAASPPIPVAFGDGNATIFGAPAANGICLVSTGTTVSVQGVLTYVQQ